VAEKKEGHQVSIYVSPSSIVALLHLNHSMIVELEMVFEDLGPFIFDIQSVESRDVFA